MSAHETSTSRTRTPPDSPDSKTTSPWGVHTAFPSSSLAQAIDTSSQKSETLRSLRLIECPKEWEYDSDDDPEKANLARASFMSRMKKAEAVYEEAGIFNRLIVVKNKAGQDVLRSFLVPSPFGDNDVDANMRFIHVQKSTQFKCIDLERLAEYEADD
ncbi:hypothetical protein G7Z17_g5485 [Cylindrodendrum hubeiense]|uniref:Uncharacterized protein n=1 Tax=Cylindrodendrum hubeiense TaxID=595255 RepID=A0A9P5HE37_9HYPO|nr:hypothetical protein G7Z17_g5485 [Cylindrodendrum hubeiense]